MQQLTKQQQAVYDFIRTHIENYAIPPTVREIGAAVGLNSTSTVHNHIKALKEKGLLASSGYAHRNIFLANPAPKCVHNVPRIGTVAAGQPIFAFDDMSMYETLPLPSSLLHGAEQGDVFILDVKGDSMIEAGINNGDMIVVHRDIQAENGDIVVARVAGDSATVKRIYKEKDKIRLQPENSKMEPIYASYEDVEVIGKVISLIRKY
ncbi:MAG: transcriptional repressor LexA [Clostridia bacterium]|nr:transcriptional repressor LexA [Clostridia bacterium]